MKTRSTFGLVLLLTTTLLACRQAREAQTPAGQAADSAVAAATITEVDGVLRSGTHLLDEVAPGVYFATGTGKVNVASNSMIVVNEHDVLVVDSHITADAGRALLATVRGLTDKPVRFLVNSHYHFDHAHGNQAFLSDEILIIGHEFSRTKLLEDVLSQGTYLTIGSPESQQGLLAAAQAQLAEAKEESRSELEAQIAMIERHISALDEVVPTPPDTTLVDKLTLHRGGREIQLLHLGRGHTGGDVVVYLPAEKVVFTGDLFYDGAPYLGDGYANEMPDTLERLAGIDWEVVVPGHGPLVRERSKIEFAQQYLRTYWDQVEAFHSQGLTPDQAMAQLDMTGYEAYSAFQQGMPAVRLLEIARMYAIMDAG